MGTICSLSDIVQMRPSLKGVVLLGGVFDILHSGHIEHLKEAKSHGSTLIVHVTSDKRVRQKKGQHRPIISEQDRAKIIAAIRYVDHVFIGDLPHYSQAILEAIKPDIVFLNHEAVSPAIREYLDKAGSHTKVVVSDTPKNISTTSIVAKIQSLQSAT